MVDLKKIKLILDGAEQRARHNAVSSLVSIGMPKAMAIKFVEHVIQSIPSLKDYNRVYIEGIIRWFIEGQLDLTDKKDLAKLDSFLRVFQGNFASEEYDRNFVSIDDKIPASFDMLCELMTIDIDSDFKNYDELQGHDYKVVKIDNYKASLPYKKYAPLWCIFQSEEAFSTYSLQGEHSVYLLLRDDYKSVPAVPGTEHPVDAYGVSLMCVIKNNSSNKIVTVTSRWNSAEEEDRFLSDSQLKSIVGAQTMNKIYK